MNVNGFSDNSIVVTKLPGSTSDVTQPADVGNVFKSIKTALSKMKNSDIYNNNLEDELTAAILSHDSLMKNFTASI